MTSNADHIKATPGATTLLSDFAAPADGNEEYIAIAETIHSQMGLNSFRTDAIRSAWAVRGKHGGGGDLIHLDGALTREGGNIFVVSYHRGRDEYTVTYARHDGTHADIIGEIEMIHADQLCETFTNMTGIKIPVIPFD